MHTNKGYIIPIILILILLLLAGVFIFNQKQAESPTVEDTFAPIATSTPSQLIPVSTSTEENEDEDDTSATTTASTTVDISLVGEASVE